MQTLWILKGICDGLDRAVHIFIWKNQENGRGLHLPNWNTITCPKVHGGMGIREARLNNVAFLGKQGWNLINNGNKLSTKVIMSKYIPHGSIFDHTLSNGALFTCRSILKALEYLKDGVKFRFGRGGVSF